ncbi:hypothetical protein SAMN05444172_8987 [Burkholderia sp. GAS332]|nr:hypothetical protein SAMN05444172_8987 [Burkholderia sp. GAS332]
MMGCSAHGLRIRYDLVSPHGFSLIIQFFTRVLLLFSVAFALFVIRLAPAFVKDIR